MTASASQQTDPEAVDTSAISYTLTNTGVAFPEDGSTTDTRIVPLTTYVNTASDGEPTDIQFHLFHNGGWVGLADMKESGTVYKSGEDLYTYDWDVCASGVAEGDHVTIELQTKHPGVFDKYWITLENGYSC